MSARREKKKRQDAKRRYNRSLWWWYQCEPPKRHFIQHWIWKLDKPKKEDA